MLDALKRNLKDLIGQARYDEAFRCLREETLRTNCDLYNDAVMIAGRYKEAERAGNLNLIDFKERGINFSNVGQALLWLIDRIEMGDLCDRLRKNTASHVALSPYHAFTCDRFDQNDQFQLAYYSAEGQKLHLFYLYGDARQEQTSLFERFGYDLGGYLANWENGDYNPGIRVKLCKLKPEVHRHPMLYQINVVKALFAKFFPRLDDKAPLQNRTLRDLLGEGSDLHGFESDDLVFILLTMDAANWNRELVPLMMENFIQKFLQVELPPSAPTFFFFFGVEYEPGQADKKAEIHEAISARKHGGEALPALDPVVAPDITEWFSRYRAIMVPPGKTADDVRREIFGPAECLDMIDIQSILLKIIELYNKGLVIRAENLQ